MDYIERHIMKKQHCVGVFLDISSAFDSIRAGHVRQALLKHGGDPDLVQWYYNYITHRDIEINLHNTTAFFTTGVGFPQGGVCSAKFWLIAFDYAIQIINRFQIEGNGYADDCSALYGGPRLDHALKRLQKMLDELTSWGKTCGLSFNPEKSVAVIFTRRHKLPPFKLKIDGAEIRYQDEVKYLGITLDSKLYWNKHITDKITKAKRFINNVAAITRNNWGPKPKLMKWAYTGIVRPMLCYGAMIWGHRAPALADKLRRVNRMAMNTFGSFPKSTPTAALEVMLDVAPLHLFCMQEALAARIRLRDVVGIEWDGLANRKTHAISHLRHWENIMDSHRLVPEDTDQCSTTLRDPKFRINNDSFTGAAKHRTTSQFNIYTDGSRHNGHTGAGFTITHNNRELASASYRLPDHATVFQAEVTAVEQAAKALTDRDGIRFIKLFIDSQATIKALGNPHIRSRSVLAARHALDSLATRAITVTLVWIPAHKGHHGNERADTLAKRGATLDQPPLQVRKPLSAVKAEIRAATYREWNNEWNSQSLAHHARSFYGGPDHNKARYVLKLARLELGRFVRIISGHNNLRFFQTKIGLSRDERCRFCDDGPETFFHFASNCTRFIQARHNLLSNAIPGPDMAWSVRDLIEFSFVSGLNEAYEGSWAHGDPLASNDLDTILEEEGLSEELTSSSAEEY